MNPLPRTPRTPGLMALALGLALLSGAALAEERKVQRDVQREKGRTQVTVTGPGGQSATRESTKAQGDKQTTVTGPQGQQATREVDRASPGEKTVTTAGPQGSTATRSVDRPETTAQQRQERRQERREQRAP